MHNPELEHITKVYFLGIGGIGMSGLARYFHSKGVPVAGYDRHRSEVSRGLEAEGISIVYEDGPAHIQC